MSNPNRAPKEMTTVQLSMSNAPDSYLPSGFSALAHDNKKIENIQRQLAALDMEVMPAIVIPREHSVSEAVLRKVKGPPLAAAKTGMPVARVRTVFAKTLANAVYERLPEGAQEAAWTKAAVGAAMKGKVYVDGGTENVIGRLVQAYPKMGSTPPLPVTRDEAVGAVQRCGLVMTDLPAPALRPYPLLPVEGEQGVTVNPHSDNGYPVLGKWSTHGAAAMCMALALSVRKELEQAVDIAEWKRTAEVLRPWLVAVKGKAKADHYPLEKVVGARMRFYNAFPRQMMLNMQVATQVMEQNARSILDGAAFRSGIGLNLTHGGSKALARELQRQLDAEGFAYVHVGDDSWVVFAWLGYVVMFALDCSNFDLTQHSAVTREVHWEVKSQLASIDKLAAELWHAYARERLVVVSGTVVRRWKHGGPSGMPLQSKVNDVLMDVMIQRTWTKVQARLASVRGPGDLEEATRLSVEEAGAGMGFVVRLEQFSVVKADTLQGALRERPFLFIGYYFHVKRDSVCICADVARTMSQVPYPSVKWTKTKEELQVIEAMRLGSICMNLGVAPEELVESFATFKKEALALIADALARFGDKQDQRLRWAVQEQPWGAAVEPSLGGLYRALSRQTDLFWLQAEKELEGTSVLQFPGTSWADLADEEDEVSVQAVGLSVWRPASVPGVRRAALKSGGLRPTHPASMANDGRAPPTVVWGPDKAPRPPQEVAGPSGRARRRDGIAAREYHEQFEDELQEWYDENDDQEDVY